MLRMYTNLNYEGKQPRLSTMCSVLCICQLTYQNHERLLSTSHLFACVGVPVCVSVYVCTCVLMYVCSCARISNVFLCHFLLSFMTWGLLLSVSLISHLVLRNPGVHSCMLRVLSNHHTHLLLCRL